ncbi:MAG: hypothetical protein JST80_11055 [Bdellovibrionales bacterium]|nr:hypothetical protein [Bdellovibrionales bacterium]
MSKKGNSMSIQSRIGRSFILFVFTVTQVGGTSFAQTTTTADPNTSNAGTSGYNALGAITNTLASLPTNIYQNPQQLLLQQQQANLQSALTACQNGGTTTAGAATGTAADIWKQLLANKKAGRASSTSKDSKSTADVVCDIDDSSLPTELTCTAPTKAYDNTTHTFMTDNTSSGSTAEQADAKSNMTAWGTRVSSINEILSRYTGTSPTCPAGRAEINKLNNQLTCMSNAMNKAAAEAAQALQSVLSANQQQYGKMNQYQGEVAEQMQQIDQILGPDKELGQTGATEFKGLIALQAELENNLSQAQTAQADFETGAKAADDADKANEDGLETSRLKVVGECLKNDSTAAAGGKALMCSKPLTRMGGADGKTEVPVTDANGRQKVGLVSCGPLRYVQGLIEQRAMMNSRGQVMNKDAEKIQESQEYSASYEGAIDAMMRELGQYTPGNASVHTWDDLAKDSQIMGKLQALDSDPNLKGVNIVAKLKSATNKCMSDSTNWAARERKRADSDYSKAKAQNDGNRKKLDAQLNNGLASLNKDYKNIMSMLSGQAVAVDRYTCPDTNKRVSCYKDMLQNARDLLEGNGRAGFTSKLIKGGTMVGGFTVPCRGVNGCVTALKSVRDRQKDHLALAQKAKMDYVNKGNQQAQQQLQSFSQILGVGSRAIQDQFAKMKQALGVAGVTDIPKLEMLEGENLVQSQNGENKEPGPYDMPKNMLAVLSGMSGGIPDIAKGSTDSAIAAANKTFDEQKKALQTKLAEAKKAQTSFSATKIKTCWPDAVAINGENGDNVKNNASGCVNQGGTPGNDDVMMTDVQNFGKALVLAFGKIDAKDANSLGAYADSQFAYNNALYKFQKCSSDPKRLDGFSTYVKDATAKQAHQ